MAVNMFVLNSQRTPSSIPSGEITTLDHKVLYDPVKFTAFVSKSFSINLQRKDITENN